MFSQTDIIIAAAAGAAMLLIFNPLMLSFGNRGKKALSLLFKALGSACAVGLAVVGAVRTGGTVPWLVAATLAVCLVADVVIGSSFVAGMGVFFVAQIIYISAMCMTAPLQWWSAVIFVPVFVCVYLAFHGVLRRMGALRFAYYLYAAALLGEMAITVALPSSLGVNGIFPALAGGLFACSDLILAKNELVSSSRAQSAVLMTLYYAALWCYAAFVFLTV